MLPPFIIDHIRQREQQEEATKCPQAELPVPKIDKPCDSNVEEDSGRGLLIIDLF